MGRITVFRLTKQKYVSTAFSGEGAKIAGGRFNEINQAAVYAAGSVSLAILEVLVNLGNPNYLTDFVYIEATLDTRWIQEAKGLPKGWDSIPISGGSQEYGSQWLTEMKSAVLRVPSVVVPTESNFVLNPLHPDVKKIKYAEPRSLHLDPRLRRLNP